MNEQNVKAFELGRKIAMIFGSMVYAGVVLLFLSFYQTLMAAQFTGFLKVLASVGAILVALNALALPLALHFWTVTVMHKAVAVTFYVLDVIVMVLNVLASAGMHSNVTPPWVVTYSEYAPASIIVTLAGWAVMYMTDPGQRALVKLSETLTGAQVMIINRAAEFIGSDEGIEKVIAPFAANLAARIFNERRLIGTPQALPAPTVTEPSPLDMQELTRQIVTLIQPKAAPQEVAPPVTPFGKNGKHSS